MKTLLLIPALLLSACWTPPPETVALSTYPHMVEVATWTADELDASENCRQWDRVGVWLAPSPEAFETATGSVGHEALAYSDVNSDRWIDAIAFSRNPPFTYVVAHEVAHLILTCQNGGLDKAMTIPFSRS